MCCLAFGEPVKKLIAANPSPITDRMGRMVSVNVLRIPLKDDSKVAKQGTELVAQKNRRIKRLGLA